ncbi:10 kda chaperonin, partial [Globisporangium splendens]
MSALRKLIPFGNRVLVKRFEPAVKVRMPHLADTPVECTASGIYLPDADQQKQNEGEVIAVGPGFRNHEGNLIPVQSAVGDKVLLPEYGGSVVKLGNEEFHLFRDEDILGKLE